MFYLRGYAIAGLGYPSALFQEPFQTLFLNSLLNVVAVLTADAQFAAGLGDVALGLAQLQDVELPVDDILLLNHGPSSSLRFLLILSHLNQEHMAPSSRRAWTINASLN